MHEQNSLPGLANRVGARIAKRVAVSFPDTPLPHAEYVGLPIRTMISGLDRPALRAEARAFFGLDPDLPTLVVTGGSQGARTINDAVAGAARALGEAGVQVLHVVGPKNDVVPQDGVPTYVPVGYVDRMDYALAAADLMVCRAGASSVTEAAAVGVPTIFVPLPIGNGEQALNAKPVVEAGGALLVEDGDVHARVGDRARPGPGHGPRSARGDERRRLRADPARRRREAGADRAGDRSMKVEVPGRRPGCRRLGRVHLVGIGGAGLSGDRPDHPRPRDRGQRERRASTRRPSTRCARWARRSTSATPPTTSATRDTVVVSAAVREDNPEYAEATARGLRVLSRAAAMASLMDGRRVVAVAGTHGKTTTTSLLTVALQEAGRRPDLHDRRRPGRHRSQRGRGERRPVRRRGRRERRRVPALLARTPPS